MLGVKEDHHQCLLSVILRNCLGWQFWGDVDMVCIYCPTAFNPADDPPRAVALRLPNSLLATAPAPLLRTERRASRTSTSRVAADRHLVLEFVQGSGHLSRFFG